ncbi:MAG: hypothetical protein ABGX16_00360 [Pirellulales bacterium]
MHDYLSIGDTSDTIERPRHQVRRACDELWPDLPRVAGARLIPRAKLCELAAAIERRFGPSRNEVAS